MKAFNLESKSITLPFGNLDCIALGEKGKGRQLFLIPCPLGIKNGDNVGLGETQSGNPRIIRAKQGAPCSPIWLARISTFSAYIKNAHGHIKYQTTRETPTIIKCGNGAFGEAGNAGDWGDYLIECPVGTILRVQLSSNYLSFISFEEERVIIMTQYEAKLVINTEENWDYIPTPEDI